VCLTSLTSLWKESILLQPQSRCYKDDVWRNKTKRTKEFLGTQNMNATLLTNEIINAVYESSFGYNCRIHWNVFLCYNYLIFTECCGFSYRSCCLPSSLYSVNTNCNLNTLCSSLLPMFHRLHIIHLSLLVTQTNIQLCLW